MFPDIKIITIEEGLSKSLVNLSDSMLIDDYGDNFNDKIKYPILFAPEGKTNYNKKAFDLYPTISNFKKLGDFVNKI